MNKGEKRIKKIYLNSCDPHGWSFKGDIKIPIFINRDLGRAMLDSIPELSINKKILTTNLEFLLYLSEKFGKNNMQNIWFATPKIFDELDGSLILRAEAAMSVIPENKIVYIEYNNKIPFEIDMKMDIIISNPPYNGPKKNKLSKGMSKGGSGNAIWDRFVKCSYDSLNDGGYMVFIHPDDWRCSLRRSSGFKNKNGVFEILADGGLKELHMMEYKAFEQNVSVDWYCYHKGFKGETKIYYVDGSSNIIKLDEKPITRINSNSTEQQIIDKVLGDWNYHNGINLAVPFSGLKIFDKNGTIGNWKLAHGARWLKPIPEYKYSEYPHIHQFNSKVILCEMGEPRAKFFSPDDEIGISEGVHYWLNKTKELGDSIAALCNSKLLLFIRNKTITGGSVVGKQARSAFWVWCRLKIEGIDGLTTDEEFYQHFKLTDEEIKLINSGKNKL